jgi:hypothetical protein
MNAEGTTSEHQRKREQRLLTVFCLGAFLFFNSLGSINVALPTIQIQFGSGLGLVFILFGILLYEALRTDSVYLTVVLALTLLGMGIGLFAPANQKVAFSLVGSEDYGILSALMSPLGTAAGTLGSTATVALIETIVSGRGLHDPAGFTAAQQPAFSSLVPLAAAALIIPLAVWRWSSPRDKKRNP